MTVTTLAALATLVSLFAAFATGLAWAQQHARRLSATLAEGPRAKRHRPF